MCSLVVFLQALENKKTNISGYSTGPWSLAGWDSTKLGSRSLSSMGGGFEWAFYWDPFLGRLDDVRFPDDGAKKGLEKLLEEGSLIVPHDAKEALNEMQTRMSTYGVVEKKNRDSSTGTGKESGEAIEMIGAMLKSTRQEDREETEVGSVLSQNMSEE